MTVARSNHLSLNGTFGFSATMRFLYLRFCTNVASLSPFRLKSAFCCRSRKFSRGGSTDDGVTVSMERE
jgi:hypothetical protein